MDKNVLRADWLLLLTALIWGTAFVAQREGMDHVGPFTYNGIRFALGSLVLIPLALRRPPAPYQTKGLPGFMQGWPLLLGGLMAGCALSIGATLQQVGLVYTTAGKAGFITGLYVIFVPILGLLWGQRVGLGGWVGAVSATVGLYFLSVTDSFTIELGDLLVLLGAFFWAGHTLMLSWLSPRMSGVRLACVQFAVCSVLSMIAAISLEEITWAGIEGGALSIAYGGIMSVGVAYTLQVVAQKHAPAFHAAIILSLEAVFAALAGWWLLDEVMGFRAIMGCCLMMAGLLICQLWPAAKAKG